VGVLLVCPVAAAAALIAATAVAFARERRARRAAETAVAELDASRGLAAQAKLDFLRAQISPHFAYNALTAIASYVRSDPERARDLLADFAEFVRWSFRARGQFATLAEEFRFVNVYLDLERARFGDRLAVSLRVVPEVLSAEVPSLVLQPLVENAVKHGLGTTGGPVRIEIAAAEEGGEAVVSVADDGAGADPRVIEDALAGRGTGGGKEQPVGLRNVNERLRAIYGDDHGLAIETRAGVGLKVTMRLPLRRVPAGAPAMNAQ
jgi:two-component system LytT family sensor kinase